MRIGCDIMGKWLDKIKVDKKRIRINNKLGMETLDIAFRSIKELEVSLNSLQESKQSDKLLIKDLSQKMKKLEVLLDDTDDDIDDMKSDIEDVLDDSDVCKLRARVEKLESLDSLQKSKQCNKLPVEGLSQEARQVLIDILSSKSLSIGGSFKPTGEVEIAADGIKAFKTVEPIEFSLITPPDKLLQAPDFVRIDDIVEYIPDRYSWFRKNKYYISAIITIDNNITYNLISLGGLFMKYNVKEDEIKLSKEELGSGDE